jgi:hypothetical protein
VVIQKQGNEKIVAQLELVLTFAEFSTPVNISKCIAFKYVHSERLTRQETDAWLQQFIVRSELFSLSLSLSHTHSSNRALDTP